MRVISLGKVPGGSVRVSERNGCYACTRTGRRPVWGKGVRIVYDPAIQITGTPTIEGHSLSAEHMASHFLELGEEGVKDDYGLTHEELIVACWWAAHWGSRKFRKAWKEWGELAGSHLRYGCINVPLPPNIAAGATDSWNPVKVGGRHDRPHTKSDIAADDQYRGGEVTRVLESARVG